MNATLTNLAEVEEHRKSRAQFTHGRFNELAVSMERVKLQVAEINGRYDEEVTALKRNFYEYKRRQKEREKENVESGGAGDYSSRRGYGQGDWRRALGEISSDLRGELEKKMDREEVR